MTDPPVPDAPHGVDREFWSRFSGSGLADKVGPPLLHLGRLVERRLGQAAAAAGLDLTPAQARIIVVLHLHGPMSQQALAGHTDVEPSTLVSTLDVMERLDLARRERHPTDRRAYLVQLTGRGERRLPKIFALWDDVEPELTADLGEAERRALVETLHALIARLSRGSGSCG